MEQTLQFLVLVAVIVVVVLRIVAFLVAAVVFYVVVEKELWMLAVPGAMQLALMIKLFHIYGITCEIARICFQGRNFSITISGMLDLDQTSNISCAEPNANELKQVYSKVYP